MDPGFIYQAARDSTTNREVELQKYSTVLASHMRRSSTENEENESSDDKLGPNESEMEIQVNDEVNESLHSEVNNSSCEEREEVLVEMRYCTICLIEQPVRCKHCRECGHCVVLHDHHCPWVGVCIGEKNRRVFWWYLLFECISILMSGYFSIEIYLDIGLSVVLLFDMALIGLFGLMVSLLLGFHTYLACANQTTWETASWDRISYLKGWPRHYKSPFSNGILSNLYYYCCSRLPEGYTIWTVPSEAPQSLHCC